MAAPILISPEETRQKVTSGSALLVCAYDDEQKCKQLHLQGAITFTAFESQLSSITRDHEIIFYCA